MKHEATSSRERETLPTLPRELAGAGAHETGGTIAVFIESVPDGLQVRYRVLSMYFGPGESDPSGWWYYGVGYDQVRGISIASYGQRWKADQIAAQCVEMNAGRVRDYFRGVH